MKTVIVYEAIKREDGTVEHLGNSYEVNVAEAKKMVKSGDFVCLEKISAALQPAEEVAESKAEKLEG